jgi:uncharacterized membrane protein
VHGQTWEWLPDGDVATSVSQDGSTVFGNGRSATGNLEPRAWGTHAPTFASTNGALVSAGSYGNAQLGTSDSALEGLRAVRWIQGVSSSLPLPTGATESIARGISASGLFAVGTTPQGAGIWWEPKGATLLSPPANYNEVRLNGISPDGSIGFGSLYARWRWEALAFYNRAKDTWFRVSPPAGFNGGAFTAANDEAKVAAAVLYERDRQGFLRQQRAALFTKGAFTLIGSLTEGLLHSRPTALSHDGTVMVGNSFADPENPELGASRAFYYSVTDGLRSLRSRLVSAGVTGLDNVEILTVDAMDVRVSTFAGLARNAGGAVLGYIARIPARRPAPVPQRTYVNGFFPLIVGGRDDFDGQYSGVLPRQRTVFAGIAYPNGTHSAQRKITKKGNSYVTTRFAHDFGGPTGTATYYQHYSGVSAIGRVPYELHRVVSAQFEPRFYATGHKGLRLHASFNGRGPARGNRAEVLTPSFLVGYPGSTTPYYEEGNDYYHYYVFIAGDTERSGVVRIKADGNSFDVVGTAPITTPELELIAIAKNRTLYPNEIGTAKVVLRHVVGTGGFPVAVTLKGADFLQAPPEVVTIPAGELSSSFEFSAREVDAPKWITGTATIGSITTTATILLRPFSLGRIFSSPSEVEPGQKLTVWCALKGLPDSPRDYVLLSSDPEFLDPIPIRVATEKQVIVEVQPRFGWFKREVGISTPELPHGSVKAILLPNKVTNVSSPFTEYAGGESFTVTMDLAAPALFDRSFNLTYLSGLLTGPAKVTFKKGEASAQVVVQSQPVSERTSVSVRLETDPTHTLTVTLNP